MVKGPSQGHATVKGGGQGIVHGEPDRDLRDARERPRAQHKSIVVINREGLALQSRKYTWRGVRYMAPRRMVTEVTNGVATGGTLEPDWTALRLVATHLRARMASLDWH